MADPGTSAGDEADSTETPICFRIRARNAIPSTVTFVSGKPFLPRSTCFHTTAVPDLRVNPFQFKSLVDEHRDRVYSYVLHMLRDPASSADVTQDVFIRLWEHRGTLEAERVLSWLLRVARNACIDEMRKHRVRQSVENDEITGVDRLMDDAPPPDRSTAASLFRDRLREALDRLGEPHRSIVILREIEGYPYNDISDQLGLPLNTVKVYLHRARKALRHDLGEIHRHDYA